MYLREVCLDMTKKIKTEDVAEVEQEYKEVRMHCYM